MEGSNIYALHKFSYSPNIYNMSISFNLLLLFLETVAYRWADLS